jgi:hypothetical protein
MGGDHEPVGYVLDLIGGLDVGGAVEVAGNEWCS